MSIHHDSVTKLCKSLNVFLVFGDDYCTVSRTPIANESRKRSKEATPPSLTLHFTAEDVTLMEEMTAKYQETVDEGEPGLEGTRYCTTVFAFDAKAVSTRHLRRSNTASARHCTASQYVGRCDIQTRVSVPKR